MKTAVSGLIRDAGYEALFRLGGFLALAVHPTQRNAEQIEQWIQESLGRKQQLRRLQAMGLVEGSDHREDWVPRLTEAGRASFAGGRHPEVAWSRPWDGKWRILSFDLPREASRTRMVLRRWMQSKHFGKLQGSLWISPDPVPSMADVIDDEHFDPSMVMVFEGQPAEMNHPREVAAATWDFDSINSSYLQYTDFATRQLRVLAGKAPTPSRLRQLLLEDRKRWWSAVRRDPLLPTALHPKSYQGTTAWKARCKLLGKLGKATETESPA